MNDKDEGIVQCSFQCDATPVTWNVLEVAIRDALNRPYQGTLTVGTTDLDADATELLGQSCTIEFKRDDQTIYYSGIVSGVEEGPAETQQIYASVDLTAALGLLAHGRHTRIFQGMRVTEILQQVLDARLEDHDRKADIRTQREYPVCEYRLQYNESDLDFCHRLMEEEGIAYWFEQDGSAELLVLSDDPQGYPEVESIDGATVPFQQSQSRPDRETIRRLDRHKCLKPTKLTMRHYDWTRPTLSIEQEKEGEEQGDIVDGAAIGPVREDYQHDIFPSTLCDYDSDKKAYQSDDSKDQVVIRRELHARDATTVDGAGGVLSFAAGRVFELTRHPRSSLDDKYLLTAVSLTFSAGSGASGMYTNSFRAMPAATAYRPDRTTAKPMVKGIETATVVGPDKQEIFTDEHGRVKVQFHWDRDGKNDDHSSCFIRVAQPWAGAGWGFLFLPRIGMEVTIAFVQGDPDRPIVTGTVYNGQNPTSYPMPDEMTKSTIRTQSSPGGDGYNELTFEDNAGKEEVYLRAQRNLREQILSDRATTVGNDQKTEISANQTLEVGKDREITVGANETHQVANSRELKVGADQTTIVGNNQKLTVGLDNEQTVGMNETRAVGINLDETIGANVTRTVGVGITETVGASVTQTIGAGLTQTIGGPAMTTAAGGFMLTSGGPTAITSGGPIMMQAPKITLMTASLDHISPSWIEVIASETTAKGNVLEAIGNKIEAGALLNTVWAVMNSAVGLHIDHAGVRLASAGADISNSSARLESAILKLIS